MRLNYHDFDLERHLHPGAYVDVVLSGSYEEAGDLGRFRVSPGDVVFHEPFESHLDRFPKSGARIISLALPMDCQFQPGLASVAAPADIVKLSATSEAEAAALLVATAVPREPQIADWPDLLARALTQDPSLSLSAWADAFGIAPWTLCRGFTRVFGVTPSAYRARCRTRLAFNRIRRSEDALGDIAINLGFSDQSHMTRSVVSLTGNSPRRWRLAANGFKTS